MKRKLLFAAALLAGAVGFNANAQIDVTAKYIKNADFETAPIFDETALGASGTNATPTAGAEKFAPDTKAVNVYKIAEWTNFELSDDYNDYERVLTMPYNKTLYVQSNNTAGGQAIAAPANGSSDKSAENKSLLAVAASWSPKVSVGIKQDVVLPKGVYKLTFDSYATTSLDYATSLCGVKIGENATYAWPSIKDTWINNEVYFVVENDNTSAEISMGYVKAKNVGVGNTPFLFVDNVKLYLCNKSGVEAQSISATDKIVNPNAKEGGDKVAAPWEGSLGRHQTAGFDGEVGFFEPGNWGAKTWTISLSQELTGLADGLYTLKAAVQSSERVTTILTAGTSHSSVFPANGTANGTIASDGSVVEAGQGVEGWNYGTVTVLVTDGTLKIGAYSTTMSDDEKLDIHQWTNLDNFTLSYIPLSALDVKPIASVTDAGYATFITPENVEFGEEVTAYIVTDVNESYATLENVTSVPADVPVILEAEEGEYELTIVENATDNVAENKLLVAEEGGVSTTGIYVLANVGNVPGFYAIDESIALLPAGKVYLNASATESKFVGFNFGGEATGINGVEAATATENAVIYNLAGQRVQNPSAGIYIVNGKKVLVK